MASLVCNTCKRVLDESEFSRDRGATANLGRCYRCKQCAAIRSKQFRLENPGRFSKEYMNEARLRSAYGLTFADRVALIDSQDGRCAICQEFLDRSNWNKCHVDHCHRTQIVRGILCARCNSGLGKFRDDPTLLEAAIVYLSNVRNSDQRIKTAL
jgi:hypothetical protein